MKRILFLIIISFIITSCKEKIVEYSNLQDRSGIKYEINSQKGYTGKAISYYENGQIETEFNYKDGLMNGEKISYYENGQIQDKAQFKDGLVNGKAFTYYENGQIEREFNYKDDVLNGEFIAYYENGQIKHKSYLINGKEDGYILSYYNNGQMKTESNKNDGINNGSFKFYYKNGNIKESRVYKNNFIVDTIKYYTPDGILERSIYIGDKFLNAKDGEDIKFEEDDINYMTFREQNR